MSTNTNFTTMYSLDMYNNCTMKQIGVRVHINNYTSITTHSST